MKLVTLRRARKWWLARIAMIVVLLAATACDRQPQRAAPAADQQTVQVARYEIRPFESPRVENPGYIGYQQCAECHAARVKECERSSHFQTCRVPTQDRMPAAFTSTSLEQRTLRLPDTDVRFEMSFRDGQFLQTAVKSVAGTQRRSESTIDLVYGAGTTSDEVYLSWHPDGTMWELPAAWIYAQDCWGAAGFDRRGGSHFARELTVRCFECHNTWFEHVPGTLNEYRREGLLLGVTCERCHGPGKEHAEYHRLNPTDVDAKKILYPGSLPRERLIEVCTQCHSNSIRHRGPALSFRPGESLEDHYRLVNPKYSEDDHVANQIQDLRQSKCFQESEMTCITCHDPHHTDEASGGMTFQETCTQCHQPSSCSQREHVPAEVTGKCVECHMRQYAKINVNFDLADDSYVPPLQRSQHRIAVDPIATQEVLLRWYQSRDGDDAAELAAKTQAELLEVWFEEGRRRAQQGRFTAAIAAIREALRVAPDSQEAHEQLQTYISGQRQLDDLRSEAEHAMRDEQDAEAIALFEKVIGQRPDDGEAHGRLGALYAKQGDRARAEMYLNEAAKLSPDDQYGTSMSAWLALRDGDYQRAAEYYQRADSIEPFNSKLNYLWGESLARAGRIPEAIERYQTSIKSDPRRLDALRALAAAYIQTKSYQAALAVAESAVRLTKHDSANDLMVLAEIQNALGQRDLASQVVDLAVRAAQRHQPQLVTEIRRWAGENNISPGPASHSTSNQDAPPSKPASP